MNTIDTLTTPPPVTERERQLEEELATLTAMYEVTSRILTKLKAEYDELAKLQTQRVCNIN